MSFLPESDQEFLNESRIKYQLLSEKLSDGTERNGVLFSDFAFVGNLWRLENAALSRCTICDLLILIPKGYSTTKLDSFYTLPRLKRPDGSDPINANAESQLFDKNWQFWSRHLNDGDWRPGTDDLRTFLSYTRNELKTA